MHWAQIQRRLYCYVTAAENSTDTLDDVSCFVIFRSTLCLKFICTFC